MLLISLDKISWVLFWHSVVWVRAAIRLTRRRATLPQSTVTQLYGRVPNLGSSGDSTFSSSGGPVATQSHPFPLHPRKTGMAAQDERQLCVCGGHLDAGQHRASWFPSHLFHPSPCRHRVCVPTLSSPTQMKCPRSGTSQSQQAPLVSFL